MKSATTFEFKYLRYLSLPFLAILRRNLSLLAYLTIFSEDTIISMLQGEGKLYKEAYITSKGKPIALAKIEDKYIFPFRVFNN